MTNRSARALGGLAALLLLVGAAACSSNDSATVVSSTSTTAGTSTTEKDTDTTSGESALERLAKGELDVSNDEDLAEAREELSSQTGLDFTDEETECLVDEFLANPDLADIGDSPTAQQASEMMDAISNCIPKEKFVSLVMEELDDGSFTQGQLDCIEEQLLTLSAADMAALMSGDADATAQFGELVAPCEDA